MGNGSSTEQSEPPITSLQSIAGVSNMQSVRYLRGGSHVTRTISLVEPRHTTIHRVIYSFPMLSHFLWSRGSFS